MTTTRTSDLTTGALLTIASSVLVLLAAFLGWMAASVGGATVSVTGLDLFTDGSPIFNGLVTIVLGIVASALALAVTDSDAASAVTAFLGVLIALVALAFVIAPETALGGGFGASVGASLASAGLGVYLTLLGGLGVVAGGLANYTA